MKQSKPEPVVSPRIASLSAPRTVLLAVCSALAFSLPGASPQPVAASAKRARVKSVVLKKTTRRANSAVARSVSPWKHSTPQARIALERARQLKARGFGVLAEKPLRQAATLAPRWITAQRELAQRLSQRGQWLEAATAWRQVMFLARSSNEHQARAGEARREFERARSQAPALRVARDIVTPGQVPDAPSANSIQAGMLITMGNAVMLQPRRSSVSRVQSGGRIKMQKLMRSARAQAQSGDFVKTNDIAAQRHKARRQSSAGRWERAADSWRKVLWMSRLPRTSPSQKREFESEAAREFAIARRRLSMQWLGHAELMRDIVTLGHRSDHLSSAFQIDATGSIFNSLAMMRPNLKASETATSGGVKNEIPASTSKRNVKDE